MCENLPKNLKGHLSIRLLWVELFGFAYKPWGFAALSQLKKPGGSCLTLWGELS